MADKERSKGQAKNVGGKVREGAGKASGDRKMEQRGKPNQAGGKLQRGIGKVKDALRGKK